MGHTRLCILHALAQLGAATIEELAEAAGVKPGTIHHHVISLQADGLITQDTRRQEIGRPRHVFALTEKGSSTVDTHPIVD